MTEDTNPNPPAPDSTPAPSGQVQGEAGGEWLKGIPEGLTYEDKGEDGKPSALRVRDNAKLAEFKDVGSLAKSYLELQKAFGRKAVGLVPPKEDASDADKAAYTKELRKLTGVPDKAEDYKLELPKDVPADDPLVKASKTWAHEAGLNSGQLQALMGRLMGYAQEFQTQQAQEAKAADEDAKKATVKTLAEVYGGPDKAAQATETASRFFRSVSASAGLTEEQVAATLAKFGDDVGILRVFAHLGERHTEDSLGKGGEGGGGGKDGQEAYLRKMYPSMFKDKT